MDIEKKLDLNRALVLMLTEEHIEPDMIAETLRLSSDEVMDIIHGDREELTHG